MPLAKYTIYKRHVKRHSILNVYLHYDFQIPILIYA